MHNPNYEDLSSTPDADRVWHTSVTCPLPECLIGATHWHSAARLAAAESAALEATAAALKAEGLPVAVEVAAPYVRQTAHFDDEATRFEILTRSSDGAMFVTDETYFRLAREFDDLYPLPIDPATGLRVMAWEVNFDLVPSPERDYTTTVDLMGNPVPEQPMTCADCGAPVFYANGGDEGYYHAVVPAPTECWGVMSWISGAVDDPRHPLYAEWKAAHA